MKHIINDYYYDKYDTKNFAIYKRKIVKKSGKEKYDVEGYYSSIRQLTKRIKEIYAIENLVNEEVETLINSLTLIENKIKGEIK